MQLLLEWSKKLAGQKHCGKNSGAVFLDVFLLPEFRSGASFAPKNHAEPVLNRMTLLVPNCTCATVNFFLVPRPTNVFISVLNQCHPEFMQLDPDESHHFISGT